MKKMISAAAAMMLASAALTACSSVSKTRSSSDVESTAPAQPASAEAVSETEPEIQLETVRERDIVSTDELYDYEVYQGGAIITKYKGNDTEVVVPDEMGGAPVTDIGFYAFEAKYDLQTVVIPDTVKTISEFAFSDCTSLSSVNVPDGVTEIQRGAFAACSSLNTITLPASVAAVREEAFTGCSGLMSLYAYNPELVYENWGLDTCENVIVYSPEGSKLQETAQTGGNYNWQPA